MSLINKMLQDLEGRSLDGAAEIDSLHPSIRPAPARRGVHPAWFIAGVSTIALALALAGFSWHKMRSRIAEIPLIVQQAQLPLKMADRLSIPVPLPQENPERPVSVQETVAGPESTPPSRANQLATTDSGNSRAEPVEADEANPKASESSPKLSARPSMESASPPKKAEGASHEQETAPERNAAPAAVEQVKNVPSETVRSSHGNDSSPPAFAKQVHELSPHEKAENDYRKAGGLIQQGRSAEAITALERALGFDPGHIGARQALIGLLLDARRTDDAMARAREGLSLDSKQAGLAIILARLQVEKSDLQGAIDTLQRSLPSGAENPEYQAFYAALMQRAGNHKEAITHYEAALRSMPQNGVWWMGMGISLQAEERLADAKGAYMRAKSSGTLSPALIAFVDQRLAQLKR